MNPKFLLVVGACLAGGFVTGSTLLCPAIADNSVESKPVISIEYKVNDSGLTYGSSADAPSPDQEPDLIEAIGTNGKVGYVLRVDLYGEEPASPEEAARLVSEDRDIPLYAADGKSVVGAFTISRGEVRVYEDR